MIENDRPVETIEDDEAQAAIRRMLSPDLSVIDAAMKNLPRPIDIDLEDEEAFALMIRSMALRALRQN
jgi:hypothetical protein